MPTRKAIYVPAGKSPLKEDLKIWGMIPMQIVVPSQATDGQLFAFTHPDMPLGGPPRHVHYEQDEWFFVTKGDFAFEIGDESFRLKAGDSLFAPRMVTHAWANVGKEPGTLLTTLQPAGTFETFIRETCTHAQLPPFEEIEAAFARHGMKVVGPPLAVG